MLSRLVLALSCLLPALAAAQDVNSPPPGGDLAQAQLDRCGPGTSLAVDQPRHLTLPLTDLLPFARDIFARHNVRTVLEGSRGSLRIEMRLGPVRSLEAPAGNPATVYLPGQDARQVLQDRRSRLRPLWAVDEATVIAADIAYDVRHTTPDGEPRPWLDETELAEAMPGYRLIRLYADEFTGFSAAVLEARRGEGRVPHRIYAIAGTHVFEHLDFRSWASGLTFGRAQFTSNAALQLVEDAATYAQDLVHGGEVLFTGQSQGGLTAQGVGYLTQAYLDAVGKPHHLAHIVSWGGVGAQEVIVRTLQAQKEGEGRGFGASLERHWAATEPDYAAAGRVWRALSQLWQSVPPGKETEHVQQTMQRMRVLGYFFEIDLFARAGTFPGTMLAFPTALILPDACQFTVAEARLGIGGGRFGVRLESHFLKGYRRAVTRGAIAVARPALPAKWPWVAELVPALEKLGYVWLETIYFEGPAASPENWRQCTAAPRWTTRANRSCQETWWPGCQQPPDEKLWCLVRDPLPGAPMPLSQ